MCPLSTVACSAVPSSLFLVSAASKINQGSGLGFLLCIWFWLLYSSFFLGGFSFFLYSPLASLSLQMNQYWREHLMCLFPRLEPAPLASEPLLWLWQVPCSPCCAPVWYDASCPASPCGVLHTVRHPPCCPRACQRVGNDIPGVEMGSSLFHACAQGGECVRKWQVKYCNSDLSWWAPCASWCVRLSGYV